MLVPTRAAPVLDAPVVVHVRLLCRVVVETPIGLTKRLRELLEEFRSIEDVQGSKQNPRKTSWFDGVKSFVDALKP